MRGHRLFITAVVALLAMVAGIAYATTASEGAGALGEYLCRGEGGVDEVIWWGEGDGEYGVNVTCNSGAYVEGAGFHCPGCEPV